MDHSDSNNFSDMDLELNDPEFWSSALPYQNDRDKMIQLNLN